MFLMGAITVRKQENGSYLAFPTGDENAAVSRFAMEEAIGFLICAYETSVNQAIQRIVSEQVAKKRETESGTFRGYLRPDLKRKKG